MDAFLAVTIQCATSPRISRITSEKTLVVTIACLVLLGFYDSARCQEIIKVTGTIVDSQSLEPVPFVHVYTASLRHGTISDATGQFTLSFTKPDTLIFSSVGYELQRLAFTTDDKGGFRAVKIHLHPKTYQLEPVQVTAYPSIEQFKHDVLNLELAVKEEFKLNIPKGARLPPEGPGDVNLNPSLSIGGPVSALYNAFGREARERKKLEALRERTNDFREIDRKYNIDVVRRVTNLDEEGAKRFMEWCKFEDEFILKSSEYELAIAMLKCLDELNRADSLR
jgi:hypothetical protein